MKCALLAAAFAAHRVYATNPIGKVVQLLSDLEAKITADGQEATKVYEEFAKLCEDRSKDLGFELKTGKSEKATLEASIAKATASMGSHSTKIEELTASIAQDEADLKAATEIRAKERAAFTNQEKELVEVTDMLERAVGILEREMAKGGSSMLQVKNMGSVVDAVSALVQASALSSTEGSKLTALVQTLQRSEDEDDGFGAPTASVYEGHSGDIVQTLQNLLEKAQTNLDETRKTEISEIHNFQMLEQSLEDEIRFGNKDLAAAKSGLAQSGEMKANFEGELATTNSDIGVDTTALADLQQDCMTKAEDFEAATKSRNEELAALAGAKKVIQDETSGAENFQYGLSQTSFLQMSQGADLANFEAVRLVRDLSRNQHSPALAQLASRMAAAIRTSGSNEDPFGKVKGLISDMIEKLEEDADADASHKAYCDKEMAETADKEEEKTSEIAKMSTKIDTMTSRSAQLKGEVAALQKSLSELSAAQAEMDKLRQSENADFVKNKADLTQGLEGVKLALKVLREYYSKEDKSHSAAEGAGTNIIGLLEVVESDLSKSIAGIVAAEETAQSTYDTETKENEIERATKDKDVEYKVKESTRLDKSVAEESSDRSGVQAELAAVLDYKKSLIEQCVAKPETYDERKRRREAEIAGLKQALDILSGEAVLLQKNAKRSLRGRR